MNDYENKMYSETYAVLDMLGENYINTIPAKIYTYIKENRDPNYNPTYTEELLSKQNISQNTAVLICMLHYNYWCKTEDEKKDIYKILNYFEQEQNIENFKYEGTIFKNKQDKKQDLNMPVDNNTGINNKNMILYNKNTKWYQKIFAYILRFFKKR